MQDSHRTSITGRCVPIHPSCLEVFAFARSSSDPQVKTQTIRLLITGKTGWTEVHKPAGTRANPLLIMLNINLTFIGNKLEFVCFFLPLR